MNNTAAKVSIALCVHNGEAHLPAQLDSLLAQSHASIEIVASDDASSDGSAAILAAYAARDPRLVVLRQGRNLGFSANFAAAMSRCTGEYICPCDQDDVWHPEKIRRLLRAIGGHDIAYCDSEMTDVQGHSLGRRLSQDRRMLTGRDPLAFVLTNCASGHAMLFRRPLLDRALPVPNGLYYDWWLAIIAACGAGLVYWDEPLVRFRRHSQTQTTLGGVNLKPGVDMRTFLEERHRILTAIASLPSHRQQLAATLAQQLRRWLDEGDGLPFLWSAARHAPALLRLLSPRLGRVAGLSLKYFLALLRRP